MKIKLLTCLFILGLNASSFGASQAQEGEDASFFSESQGEVSPTDIRRVLIEQNRLFAQRLEGHQKAIGDFNNIIRDKSLAGSHEATVRSLGERKHRLGNDLEQFIATQRLLSGLWLEGDRLRLKKSFHEGIINFYDEVSSLLLKCSREVSLDPVSDQLSRLMVLSNTRRDYFKNLWSDYMADSSYERAGFIARMAGWGDYRFVPEKDTQLLVMQTPLPESLENIADAVNLVQVAEALLDDKMSQQYCSKWESMVHRVHVQELVAQQEKFKTGFSPDQAVESLRKLISNFSEGEARQSLQAFLDRYRDVHDQDKIYETLDLSVFFCPKENEQIAWAQGDIETEGPSVFLEENDPVLPSVEGAVPDPVKLELPSGGSKTPAVKAPGTVKPRKVRQPELKGRGRKKAPTFLESLK